jgi:hypothetical protein
MEWNEVSAWFCMDRRNKSSTLIRLFSALILAHVRSNIKRAALSGVHSFVVLLGTARYCILLGEMNIPD